MLLIASRHTCGRPGPLCPFGRINGEACEHGTSCLEIAYAREVCQACGPALPTGRNRVRTFPARILSLEEWQV